MPNCLGMKSIASIASTLLLFAGAAQADLASSSDIASLEAGIVCAPEPVGSLPAPGTVAGTTHVIDTEPQFVSTAQRVPAVLGVGFGVKSRSTALDGIDGVTMVVTHPAMGDENVTAQNFETRISGDTPSLTFYQFDFAYELVLGTWQFTAMSGKDTLYSVAFEVVDPRQVPELVGVCGYLELLS